ncbi:DNA-binding protein [bacterium]|nr:DNA-binding protein [bacterium]
MKTLIQDDTHVLALEIGEELVGSILRYSEQSKIHAASIQAIGAIRNFELGYYVLDQKQYLRKKVDEIAELIGCSGNLAMKNDKTICSCSCNSWPARFQCNWWASLFCNCCSYS